MLFKVTNTLYPKPQVNHTVNIQSGLGLSRVVREKLFLSDSERKITRLCTIVGIALTFNILSLLDPVLNM
jgi:hypothetical protein